MKTILQSIRALFVFTLLTGVVYPLAVTVIARVAFPKQADGSLIVRNGTIVGSSLLAQKCEDPRYFWPRPSAGDYATVASGASNKGPTSADLVKAISERREKLGKDAPADMLTASGSGLDPHISPEAAAFQIDRVAAARKISRGKIAEIVGTCLEAPQLGILGEPRVNVLQLNLALDRL
jgi:K+-transporting ATPase ATPase C chain